MAFIPGAETHPISDAQSVSGNRLFNVIQIADSNGDIIDPATGNIVIEGDVIIDSPLPTLQGLGIPLHDYFINTYDTNNNLLTTTYKVGGAGGTVVAIVTMTYDSNNNLLTATKTIP